jgi:hypothetical protein
VVVDLGTCCLSIRSCGLMCIFVRSVEVFALHHVFIGHIVSM